ncbi:SGS-domain-containing protein [Rickenella mellea]|uniref:SGS-domain-containing protein n=1 Tax=Rickenella mellea TaxID=50990 RepID=A0A4Y7QLV7_9AGAM|nr:SGS-domain-containing protein [Rickenella mellea]
MTTPRHEFYETDEKLTLSVFDKNAIPDEVSVKFEPRSLVYEHGDKKLVLQPLKGEIDPDASDFTVGKVKVEIRLVKRVHFRWGVLEGDTPDVLATSEAPASTSTPVVPDARPKPKKNWESITTNILSQEKEKSLSDDPNAGGDTAVNGFFQKLFDGADEDTKRAMMKSYQESGGTTLSTNWDEVGKGEVEVKPPQGSEWKKWAA